MHKCLKCGRIAQSLSEISEGCTCGSKVFVYTRLSDGTTLSEPSHSITLIPNLKNQPSAPHEPPKPTKHGDGEMSPPAGGKIPASDAAGESHVPADASAPISSSITHVRAPLSDSRVLPVSVEAVVPSYDMISEAILNLEPVEEEPALRSITSTVASAPIPQADEDWLDSSKPYSEVWLSKGGSIKPLEQGTQIQSADPASDLMDPDVANVRQLRSGIYEIDVGRLKGEPLVIQDSDGVYYVRLPFVPLGEAAPGEMTKEKR